MWGLRKYLTDAQITGLAAYYAKQQTKSTWQSRRTLAANADGKKIFEEGIASSSVPACKTCHGAEARGAATFPRLAGQHADYTVMQLMVSSARTSGQKAQ
ncbi:MAG: c-type cytochrome [Chloroflexota bacterium]